MITSVQIAPQTAAVDGVQLQACSGGAWTTTWSNTGGWPVGQANGVGGASVIETDVPLNRLSGSGPMRVGVVSSAGALEDALLTSAGNPILIQAAPRPPTPAPIPALGSIGITLLALMMIALAWRRGPRSSTLLVMLLAVTVSTLTWAAFLRDGQTTDWTGIAPLATQTSSVPAPAGLAALFARSEGRDLNLRIDAVMAFTPPTPNQAPTVDAGTDQTVTLPAAANLSASVSDDGLPNPPGAVTLSWSKVSGPGTVTFGSANAASTTAAFSVAGVYQVRLTADDGALQTSDTVQVTVDPEPITGLPPDPATVAPPVDPTVATTTYAATEFLYTGENPIQTGVEPGTIEARRVAVLRGRVLDRQNNPLSGVTVSVNQHPELGQTLSRADGLFDLAVNGGGYLTLNYRKDGYLPAQRQVNAPWQDFALPDDVVLIQQDAQVTTIDLADTSDFPAAQGSAVTDADGTRQPALLIPPGTQAQRLLPDGSTEPLDSLSLRLTEYTVGPNGPAAMPAPLPANVAYTYALEISTDEAPIKRDGRDVLFDRPVPFYVTNFLDFPVGTPVPMGYYDYDRGVWVPSDNGRVIALLGVTGGLADLDVTGTGSPSGADDLAELAITDAERARLAGLYPVGTSLWRVPVTHLSTWDCNFSPGLPQDAIAPPTDPEFVSDPKEDDPTIKCGSVIECENQVLGQRIPVVGTGLALNYRSDRTPGRLAFRTLRIQLTGNTVPASLKRVDAAVEVAGRSFDLGRFPAEPNQWTSFVWDGNDAYGRELSGAQPATVTIDYLYDIEYDNPKFLIGGGPSFGRSSGIRVAGSQAREEAKLSRSYSTRIGVLDWTTRGVGGWSVDVHHVYDPIGRVLYLGDGSHRSAQGQENSVINTVAGVGTGYYDSGFSGDGGPANAAELGRPSDVAVAADGSYYIADYVNNRIRRVMPDGIITTVAGTGEFGFGGDGGSAIEAKLWGPVGVAVAPDGSLYIVDHHNRRIRRVRPDGIITTVAGSGERGHTGDGGPATAATFYSIANVALAPDGSLYIDDDLYVRKVAPDGIISTVAGGGSLFDGGPATAARLNGPSTTIAPDGSLYIADYWNHRIRHVGLNGIITTVAGSGESGYGGDGGPATAAKFYWPLSPQVMPDGTFYFVDHGNNRIRRVGSDGIITTVAGTGELGFGGDAGPATAATTCLNGGLALAPDGGIFVAEACNNRIRHLSIAIPAFSAGDIQIASTDDRSLYRFDSIGRHLSTVDTLTGATLYTFAYDTDGHLTSITDADANVITIERDADGTPTAIVAPFGQRTTLTLNSNGYLASVTNPAGETHRIDYTADGLLTAFTDPEGHRSDYSYDALGRLQQADNAAGGGQDLTRTELDDGYRVTRATALGRATEYDLENLSTGDRQRRLRGPDGTETLSEIGTDGSTRITAADGTVTETLEGPDPRFGMQSPVTTDASVTTGGITATAASSLVISPEKPNDLLSFDSLTATSTINGRTATSIYTQADRRTETTSAANRQSYSLLDAQGRLIERGEGGLEPVRIGYDGRGRLSTITQGSGADARALTLAYDTDGNLASITDPLGRSAGLGYDLAGRLTRQTFPDGREVLFGYDANGNLTSLTPPGRPAHRFTYTPVNLTDAYLPPDLGAGAEDTRYSYNADKQLTRVLRPDGKALDLAYDAAGRLATLSVPGGDYSYGYDAATGKLTQITAPDGGTLSLDYDGALLTGTAWTGTIAGNVGFAYDNDFRVASIEVNGADPIAFQYDPDGLLIQAGDLALTRDTQNGLLTASSLATIVDTHAYNGFGEPTSYGAAQAGSPLIDISYTRDKLGRITEKTETLGGVTTTYAYDYDLAGRLVEVRKDGAVQTTWAYDANGNRTHVNGTEIAHYDDQDRLLDYAGATYAYTANGELLTKTEGTNIAHYDYDVLGNLRQVRLPNGTVIDYVIDGRNRRIGKQVNGTLVQGFLYQDQLKPVAELDGAGNLVSRFVYATHVNVPDYLIKGGETYRILTDHLGSPRLVVDAATGAIAQRMDYDAWGNVLVDTNPGFQPFGFAGGLYDRDTGLVRFGARDYDPVTGRWQAKDSSGFVGGSTNLYQYAAASPVELIDTNGEFPTRLPPFDPGVLEDPSFNFPDRCSVLPGSCDQEPRCSEISPPQDPPNPRLDTCPESCANRCGGDALCTAICVLVDCDSDNDNGFPDERERNLIPDPIPEIPPAYFPVIPIPVIGGPIL